MDALMRDTLLRGNYAVDIQLNGKWSIRLFEDNSVSEALDGKEFNTEDEAVDYMRALYEEAKAQA